MRKISVVTFCLMVVVSYGFYQLQFKVEAYRDTAAALERQIDWDEKNIKILQAEWALLSSPKRLQQLSNKFLQLAPLDPAQIRTIDELAMRKNGIEGAAFVDPGEVDAAPSVAVAAASPVAPPVTIAVAPPARKPQLPTTPVANLGMMP